MYESFFGFSEAPFSLNPDPEFLYLGQNHSKALSVLEFGLASNSGITVVTGDIGAGKTTLVRHLLNHMPSSNTIGLITNTHKSFGNLIDWLSMTFGLAHEGKDKVSLYNQFVEFMINEYANNRRVVIIVDEAQNLDEDTIEELRVISNINADKDLVMQLVLLGQPELRETLASPNLAQFVQRISAYYHLKPLKKDDAFRYVNHRTKIAGAKRNPFRRDALEIVYEHSGGVPRLMNTLCHLGLTYAFGAKRKTVSSALMKEVIEDRDEHGLFGAGMGPQQQPVNDLDRELERVESRKHSADSTEGSLGQ